MQARRPHGSFVLNYRSKHHGAERGTIQYELVFWLRDLGFLFCEDFVWGKPSPPPGRFNRFLKDAVEYCFHFAKGPGWQFFPAAVLQPARWDKRDRERRARLAHNFQRVNAPSGHAARRESEGPPTARRRHEPLRARAAAGGNVDRASDAPCDLVGVGAETSAPSRRCLAQGAWSAPCHRGVLWIASGWL